MSSAKSARSEPNGKEASARGSYETAGLKPSPIRNANIFSLLTMWFANQIVSLGSKRALEVDDVWTLPPGETIPELTTAFEKNWEAVRREDPTHQGMYIVTALFRSFKKRWVLGGLAYSCSAAAQLAQPYFIKQLVLFMADPDASSTTGYLYGMGLVLVTLGMSTCTNQQFFQLIRLGCMVRATMLVQIYKKALKMSNATRMKNSIGSTVNLMSNDTQRCFEACSMLHFLWISPTTIVIAFILMIVEVGWAAVPAMFLMLIMLPLQSCVSRLTGANKRRMLSITDERVKAITEVLQGVRVLKFYAWEEAVAAKIIGIRTAELARLRYSLFLGLYNMSVTFILPSVVILVCLGTYASIHGDLNVAVTFSILAYINILRMSLQQMPNSIQMVSEGRVSLSRLDAFLRQEDLPDRPILKAPPAPTLPPAVTSSHVAPDAIVRVQIVDDALFQWEAVEFQKSGNGERKKNGGHERKGGDGKESRVNGSGKGGKGESEGKKPVPNIPTLVDINLEIREGELVALIGHVGSGKTSLISAILQEIPLKKGRVNIFGSLAYTSQENWIRNETLRGNICFGLPMDAQLYDQVVDAAALRHDFSVLPHGDNTEIGERGINLSGGQKQRVSMARALYRVHQSDIYLFDDPFSAVDMNVGTHIFKHAVLGVLKHKTRVIAMSSHLHLLKHVDRIIVIDRDESKAQPGRIVAMGTYDELKGTYAALMTASKDAEQVNDDELAAAKADTKDVVSAAVLGDISGRQVSAVSPVQSSDALEITIISHRPKKASIEQDPALSKPLISPVGSSSSVAGKTEGTLSSAPTTTSSSSSKGGMGSMIKDEDRKSGSVEWHTYKQYFTAAFPQSPRTIIACFLTAYALAQSFVLMNNIWLSFWSEQRYFGDKSQNWWIGIYVCWLVGSIIFTVTRAVMFVFTVIRASHRIFADTFTRLLGAPVPTFFDVTPIGRILNRFAKDLDQCDSLLPQFSAQFLQNFFMMLGALAVTASASAYLLLLFLPIICFFFLLQGYFRKTSRELKRIEGVTRSPIYSLFSETLIGLTTIRAYAAQHEFTKSNFDLTRINSQCFFTHYVLQRWLALRLDWVGLCVMISVVFLLVPLRDQVVAGLAGLALVYSLQFTGMLQFTVRSSIEMENQMTAVERLLVFQNTPQERAYHIPETEPAKDWPSKGVIQIRDFCLRYRPELPLVLKGVTCTINAQEKIGICGRTGAGKSSLMIALFRLAEADSGSIVIDGVDISTIGLGDLRSKLSIIPQDPVLFSGDIRYNLDPFKKCTDEEMWSALERVHLKATVQRLEGQLDAKVAENGENFSQGQRQLICIGRALLRRSKVIVLDEATSSVDAETDNLIQDTIRVNFSQCTVLTIAHRLDTIMDSDRILVIADGVVAEFDRPQALLEKRDGVLRDMVTRSGDTNYKRLHDIASGKTARVVRPSTTASEPTSPQAPNSPFYANGWEGDTPAEALLAHSPAKKNGDEDDDDDFNV